MKRISGILFVVLFSLAASCSNPKHTAVVVDNSLYEVLNDTFVSEQAFLHSGNAAWDVNKSQAFNKKLLIAVSAGREFNKILANWKTGQPIPTKLHDAINAISDALKQVTLDMPDGTVRSKILGNLGQAEAIILNAIDLVLSVKA